jgi:hypothetical protein
MPRAKVSHRITPSNLRVAAKAGEDAMIQIVLTLRATSQDPVDTVESAEQFCAHLKEKLLAPAPSHQIQASVEYTVSEVSDDAQ